MSERTLKRSPGKKMEQVSENNIGRKLIFEINRLTVPDLKHELPITTLKPETISNNKFINKLFRILSTSSYFSMIAWSPEGNVIEIKDEQKMVNDILPLYFKNKSFAHFVRQLNIYGFKKVRNYNNFLVAYSNPLFVRDNMSHFEEIKRNHTIKNRSIASTSPSTIRSNNKAVLIGETQANQSLIDKKKCLLKSSQTCTSTYLNKVFNKIKDLEIKVSSLDHASQNLLDYNSKLSSHINRKIQYLDQLELGITNMVQGYHSLNSARSQASFFDNLNIINAQEAEHPNQSNDLKKVNKKLLSKVRRPLSGKEISTTNNNSQTYPCAKSNSQYNFLSAKRQFIGKDCSPFSKPLFVIENRSITNDRNHYQIISSNNNNLNSDEIGQVTANSLFQIFGNELNMSQRDLNGLSTNPSLSHINLNDTEINSFMLNNKFSSFSSASTIDKHFKKAALLSYSSQSLTDSNNMIISGKFSRLDEISRHSSKGFFKSDKSIFGFKIKSAEDFYFQLNDNAETQEEKADLN